MALAVPAAKAGLVLTLGTCQHPASAHAFSVPINESDMALAAIQTLSRAGEKLGFQPQDVVGITAYRGQLLPQPPSQRCPEERCCCGTMGTSRGPEEVAKMMQDLMEDARQMQDAGLRPRATGLLHILPRKDLTVQPALRSTGCTQAADAVARPEAITSIFSQTEVSRPLDKHELQLRKKSPRSLRQDAQGLWTALEKSKVYIPPVPDDAPTSRDRFHLERHGHGRGNTKSTKKRRKREDRESLCRQPSVLSSPVILKDF